MTRGIPTGWPPDEEPATGNGIRLWTSRYSAQDEIIASGCVPVGTSIGQPKMPLRYRLADVLLDIAPTWGMVKIADDWERYTRAYVGKLERVGVERIARQLHAIAEREDNDDLVLLCYENVFRPGQQCHRRLFADWWLAKVGDEVRELRRPTFEERARSMTPEQGRLLLFEGDSS